MKATVLIKEQHDQVRAMVNTLEKAPTDEQPALSRQLAACLRAHFQIEQELLYPRFESKEGFEELISDSFAEHEDASEALGDFERTTPGTPEFLQTCQIAADLVFAHMEEEETELIPRVEAAWSDEMLEQLGLEMKRRFDELLDQNLTGGEEARV